MWANYAYFMDRDCQSPNRRVCICNCIQTTHR